MSDNVTSSAGLQSSDRIEQLIKRMDKLERDNVVLRKDMDKLIPTAKDYVLAGALGGAVGLATSILGGYIGGLSIFATLALGAAGGIVGLTISVSSIYIFTHKEKTRDKLYNIWLGFKDAVTFMAAKQLYYILDEFCQKKTGMKLA